METVLGGIDSGTKKHLILGDSGSGKTLFTWELENNFGIKIARKACLPIRIELASLEEEAVKTALLSVLTRLGLQLNISENFKR